MVVAVFIYLFFALAVFLVMRMRRDFIFILPLFNVLADISFSYFEGFSAGSILRAVVLAIFLLMFWDQLIKVDILKSLYLFFLYISLLLLFSGEFLMSLKTVVQVILSMSMFIVGYRYITNYVRYQKLLNNLTWVILAGLLATVVGYIFDIGKTLEYTANINHEGNEEYIGLLGSGSLYGPALALALLPLITKSSEEKILQRLLWIFSAVLYIFIILNVRRTVILIPITGLVVFMIFTKGHTLILRYMLFSALLIMLLAPVYRPLLEKRFEVRAESGRFEKGFLKSELRYKENIILLQEVKEFKEPLAILFGIGNNIFAEHVNNGKIVRRMYHSDSAKLVYGTGLFGFALYLVIYGQMLYLILKIPRVKILNEYRTGALVVWIISLIVSFNGSITLVTFRSLSFLLIGTFLGMANAVYKSHGAVLAVTKR